MRSLVYCVVVCVAICLTAAAHDTRMDNEEEDQDQLYHYRAPDELIDPFDMLSYSRHEPVKTGGGVRDLGSIGAQKAGVQRTESVTGK